MEKAEKLKPEEDANALKSHIMFDKVFYILFFTYFCNDVKSQWSQTDSIWLQDILSGKREIKINLETQKSIEQGTFLNFKEPTQSLIQPTLQLQILKEFTNIALLDSFNLNIDHTHIPPCVFLLYDLPLKNEYNDLQCFSISIEECERLKRLLPSAATFNGENMMRFIFWKSHRAKVRNKKKATSWKYYNFK